MNASHPGHRQWHPRSERTKGCAPSGSVSAALTSILSASPASGPEPAAYATIPPSCQSTGGKRHALPVPGLDPGDVRQPLLVRPFGGEVPVGQVAGRGSRTTPVGTVPAPFGRVRHEPVPGRSINRVFSPFDRRRRPAPGLFRDLRHLPHQRVPPVPVPRPRGAKPRHRHRRRRMAGGGRPRACRSVRRSRSRVAARPCRPHGTP